MVLLFPSHVSQQLSYYSIVSDNGPVGMCSPTQVPPNALTEVSLHCKRRGCAKGHSRFWRLGLRRLSNLSRMTDGIQKYNIMVTVIL